MKLRWIAREERGGETVIGVGDKGESGWKWIEGERGREKEEEEEGDRGRKPGRLKKGVGEKARNRRKKEQAKGRL